MFGGRGGNDPRSSGRGRDGELGVVHGRGGGRGRRRRKRHGGGRQARAGRRDDVGAQGGGSGRQRSVSFHDFRMVNNHYVIEQAHEVQVLVKELELKCHLLDKFVAGCIIAKLPSSWTNFATTLKHKRHEISVENLIASLDVEEKARAKDVSENGGEGNCSANMVQKHHPHSKNKKAAHKPIKTTTFKKKKTTNSKGGCYMCGDGGHFARDCPNCADRKAKANPGTGSKGCQHDDTNKH